MSPTCSIAGEATILLDQQESLRAQLRSIMVENKPMSGLYTDEGKKLLDNKSSLTLTFRQFVLYMCRSLSRSPRTVLRQALTCTFQEHLITKHDNEDDDCNVENGNQLQKLCHLLGVDRARASMHTLSKTLKHLSPGRCYQQLEAARRSMETPCLYETDPEAFRAKVITTSNNYKQSEGMCIEIVISTAIQKDELRRRRIREKADRLMEQLTTDSEFQTYQQANKLWQNSGAKQVWENYLGMDLAISKRRGKRGANLEHRVGKLCFAMIALELIKTAKHGQEEGVSSSSNIVDFSYLRNVFWWKDGKSVGEIDLAVLYRDKVVAICEIKSSCYEIACAMRQHEDKLAAATAARSVNKEQPTAVTESYTIGETKQRTTELSSHCNIPIFVSTVLPGRGDDVLGSEPALAHSICEGIRLQGISVADAGTKELCRPLIQYLLTQTSDCLDPLKQSAAMEYIDNLPFVATNHPVCDHKNIDFEELNTFVRQKMAGMLDESPAGCFSRCCSRILVHRSGDEI